MIDAEAGAKMAAEEAGVTTAEGAADEAMVAREETTTEAAATAPEGTTAEAQGQARAEAVKTGAREEAETTAERREPGRTRERSRFQIRRPPTAPGGKATGRHRCRCPTRPLRPRIPRRLDPFHRPRHLRLRFGKSHAPPA